LQYVVLRHRSRAISTVCSADDRQVGFPLWLTGDAELTCLMDAAGWSIEHDEIRTRPEPDIFMRELLDRLDTRTDSSVQPNHPTR
jgi:hypothetical protein